MEAQLNLPRLFIHRWNCAHEEVVDDTGGRVDPLLKSNVNYDTVERKAAYPCPQCNGSQGSQPFMATNVVVPRDMATLLQSEPLLVRTSASWEAEGPQKALIYQQPAVDLQHSTPMADTESGLNPFAAAFNPGTIDAVGMRSPSPPVPFNPPKGPRFMTVKHKQGHPCPYGDPKCHWHHSDNHPCHLEWNQCKNAIRAIRSAMYAKGPWTGAPKGWNAEHASCIRERDPVRCEIHDHLYRDWEKEQAKIVKK